MRVQTLEFKESHLELIILLSLGYFFRQREVKALAEKVFEEPEYLFSFRFQKITFGRNLVLNSQNTFRYFFDRKNFLIQCGSGFEGGQERSDARVVGLRLLSLDGKSGWSKVKKDRELYVFKDEHD